MAENNHELIGFIASTVEAMRDQMATKSDIAQMATKSDIAEMATKSDIAEMATKSDIAQMATKSDIAKLEATTTAIRDDIEQVQLRLDGIAHSVNSRFEHVEGEISRLRSAVYVLGKDRPEVLRLLGQSSG